MSANEDDTDYDKLRRRALLLSRCNRMWRRARLRRRISIWWW